MIWWTGAIVGLAVAVLLLAGAIVGGLHLIDVATDRLRHAGRVEGMAWSQNKLRSTAWWFSEDEPTRALLADLAELSEWDAREQWRKRRKAQNV